jgi:Domain of unknown function DUF11
MLHSAAVFSSLVNWQRLKSTGKPVLLKCSKTLLGQAISVRLQAKLQAVMKACGRMQQRLRHPRGTSTHMIAALKQRNAQTVAQQILCERQARNPSNHLTSVAGGSVVVISTRSSTDLRVRIGNGLQNIVAGSTVRYDIVVDNIGAQAAVGRLQVPLSADYASASFSCSATGQAACGAVGSGSIDTEISLAPGAAVIYSLLVTAPINPERVIAQGAQVSVKAPTTDSDSSNDQATDNDPMGLLADGFEDASVSE